MRVSGFSFGVEFIPAVQELSLKKIDVGFFAAARQALDSRPPPAVLPRPNSRLRLPSDALRLQHAALYMKPVSWVPLQPLQWILIQLRTARKEARNPG